MRRIRNSYVIALVLCVSLITLFCISSYDWKDKYPWPIGDIDNTIVPIEGLSARLVEGTLSRTGFSFIVENTGHDLVIFGASYYLQVYRKGSWYAIDNSPSEWTAEGYVVPCDGSHYFTRDWSSIYGELPDGKYRFIWPFRYVDKDFRLISDEEFRLSLEFDIKTNWSLSDSVVSH